MNPRLTLYSKAGCSLCDEAHVMLDELSGEFGWEWRVVDIDGDSELSERFGSTIPVIVIENGATLSGRITQEALLDAIAERTI
ncbi:MAG: glutaredoxin family protein [Caldilineales bacterium]|nr:glutaredoxin family protein [Caldilineales bacterium]